MNYYDARQKQNRETGEIVGWHYTCRNDDRIWVVGDCAGHDPHPTQGEAYECYTRYLLRERSDFEGRDSKAQRRCKECGSWTDRFATVDGSGFWPLCDDHRTATVVAKLFGIVGAATSSW